MSDDIRVIVVISGCAFALICLIGGTALIQEQQRHECIHKESHRPAIEAAALCRGIK